MREAAAVPEDPGFPWYLGNRPLPWIDRVSAAVREGDAARITRRVKGILEGLVGSGDLDLPEAVCRPRREGYARRELACRPDRGKHLALGLAALWLVLDLPEGRHEIVARAWDAQGRTQPERPQDVWNFKGYLNNSWPRVAVRCG